MLAVPAGRALTEVQPANLTAVFSLKEVALETKALLLPPAFLFALQFEIAGERPRVEVEEHVVRTGQSNKGETKSPTMKKEKRHRNLISAQLVTCLIGLE